MTDALAQTNDPFAPGWKPTTNELLKRLDNVFGVRPRVTFADGTSVSIQASGFHYCEPKTDEGPWTEVELGFPSREIAELMPYAESPEKPCDTVYGYVPVAIVDALIIACGGLSDISEDGDA